jgi:hypothetical protein
MFENRVVEGIFGSERKSPHWRCRCRWKDNIKMNIKETGCADTD